MNKISHVWGMTLGVLFALIHASWALLVAIGWAGPLMSFILGLHFLNNPYTVKPFDLGNAILLVIVTGIIGYIFGWVGGMIWTKMHRG